MICSWFNHLIDLVSALDTAYIEVELLSPHLYGDYSTVKVLTDNWPIRKSSSFLSFYSLFIIFKASMSVEIGILILRFNPTIV